MDFGTKYELSKSAVEVFEDKPMWQRPVSSTVGRLTSPLVALMLGVPAAVKPGPTKEDLENVSSRYEDDMDDIELAMYPNYVNPLENIKRIWKRRKLGLTGKLLGTILQPTNAISAALGRADHYDPFAHSVTSFISDPAIEAHELGHAKDFQERKLKTLYTLARALPPVMLAQEYEASRRAVPYLIAKMDAEGVPKDKQREVISSVNRKLGAAFGSYLGSVGLGPTAIAGGHIVGKTAQPFGSVEEEVKEEAANKEKEKAQ
jgi:hypothetical protein